MFVIRTVLKDYSQLYVFSVVLLLQVASSASRLEGDTCLLGGDVRGVCKEQHRCRATQGAALHGNDLIRCNSEDRETELVCCPEQRSERVYENYRGSIKHKNDFIDTTRRYTNDERLDDLETIFDVKQVYQEPYTESSRKKHSIPATSNDKHKPSYQQAVPAYEPNNVQPFYVQQNKPDSQHIQRPTYDNYPEQKPKGSHRNPITTPTYSARPHSPIKSQQSRPANQNVRTEYEDDNSNQQTERYSQPATYYERPYRPTVYNPPQKPNYEYETPAVYNPQPKPNYEYETPTYNPQPKPNYEESYESPQRPSTYDPQPKPNYQRPAAPSRRPPSYNQQPANEPTRKPAYQQQPDSYEQPNRPSNPRPTSRPKPSYSSGSDQSPWQEPPRPLVEDGNGYPDYVAPTTRRPYTTRRPTTRRPQPAKKSISEMKCKEYSQVVTSTIAGLPLTTDPRPVNISIQKCNYNAQKLIVGGQNTSVGEFPHMAAVGFLNKQRRTIAWNCGGSLISEHFVLTAAHCTTSSFGAPSVVRLGEYNLMRGDDGAHPVDYLVKQVIRHQDYRPPARYNDIALLRLSRPVAITTHIRPACLYAKPTFNSGKAIATGWGRIEYAEEQSDVLLKVVLSLIDNERCNGLYRSESKTEVLSKGIIDKQVCAGELSGGKDTCQGDSGGPIEVTSGSNQCVHHVIGVTSFGKRCAQPNTVGVYTRVSSYIPWIESVVWPELVQQHNNS